MVTQVWKTQDGKIFDTPEVAEAHELREQAKVVDPYQDYCDTYFGRKLFAEYKPDEVGIWEVRGEDPNCDFGGSHHNPYLFTAQGRLEDVVKKAVVHKDFWQWGSGGKIRKIEVQNF